MRLKFTYEFATNLEKHVCLNGLRNLVLPGFFRVLFELFKMFDS